MEIFQLIENEEYETIRRDILNFDLESVDENGDTVLHFAVKNEDYELLDIILSYVPDLDVENLDGDSALHLAVKIGNSEIVRMLIDFGASTHVRDSRKRTPEKLAAEMDEDVIYRILKDNDEDEDYVGGVEKFRKHAEFI